MNSAKSFAVFNFHRNIFVTEIYVLSTHCSACILPHTFRTFQKLADMFTNAIIFSLTSERNVSAAEDLYWIRFNMPSSLDQRMYCFKSLKGFVLGALSKYLSNDLNLTGSTLLNCTYRSFSAEEIYLNSRTFLWTHELELVLELSGARLSVVRENLEVALK